MQSYVILGTLQFAPTLTLKKIEIEHIRTIYLVLQSSSPADLHTEGKKWKRLSKCVAFL